MADDFDFKQHMLNLTYLALRTDGGLDTVIGGQLVYSIPRCRGFQAPDRGPAPKVEYELAGYEVEIPVEALRDQGPDLVERRLAEINKRMFCSHGVQRSARCVCCELELASLREVASSAKREGTLAAFELTLLAIPGVQIAHVADDPDRPGLLAVAYLGSASESEVCAWMREVMGSGQRTLDVRCYGEIE